MALRLLILIIFGSLGLEINLGQIKPDAVSDRSTIRGRITDLLGNPLFGTRVRYLFDGQEVSTSQTDRSGEYALQYIPTGNGDIVAEGVGFKKYSKKVYLSPSEEKLFDIGLEAGLLTDAPEIHVRGTVRDNDSKPLRNVTVTARNLFNSEVTVATKTSTSGTYVLDLNALGQYYVYATSPGNEAVGRMLVIDSHKAYLADLRFERQTFGTQSTVSARIFGTRTPAGPPYKVEANGGACELNRALRQTKQINLLNLLSGLR